MDFVCHGIFFSAPLSFHFVPSPSPCSAVLPDLGGVDSTVHPSYLFLLRLNVLVYFLYFLFQLLQTTAVLCLTSTLERLCWVFN